VHHCGFYRYAVEEELLDHSPAAHVRRPRLDYESHAIGLDRNELGALLVAAGLGEPAEHALVSLLALNGLRVSEATGANIEALGVERGHRTLVITRKGGKVVTIPLAPRTARAIDLAVASAATGLSSWPPMAGDWTAMPPRGSSAGPHTELGSPSRFGPHTLRHAFITAAQMSRIAFDASFGRSCEHALPAPQLAGLRCCRAAGAPHGWGDLGLHGRLGSDATMMRLMSWRGVHHRCAWWHRDASGSSRLHRVHHQPVPVSGARPVPQPRGTRWASASLATSRA
jgi:hypothetical protein